MHSGGFEFIEIFGAVVGHGVTFKVPPGVFIGVQFRGVCWQELHMDSRMSAKKGANFSSPMGIESIPDEEDFSAHVTQKITQEGNDLFLANGAITVEVQVPAQSAMNW